jgi:Icc-related predicted phosphoesterase
MKHTIKILALSDLHGVLPEISQPADVAIIAGDIVPLELQNNMQHSKWWFENEFAAWIETIPAKKVFFVAGNHDFYLEKIKKSELSNLYKITKNKLKYLMNENTIYIDDKNVSWSIFGTPYCSKLLNWPFGRKDSALVDKYKKIPNKVDIIISHDAPFAYGDIDIISSKPQVGHIGNEPLAARLDATDYKLLVCGHIHTGDHKFNEQYKTVNVSILNEGYTQGYEPTYITIEK